MTEWMSTPDQKVVGRSCSANSYSLSPCTWIDKQQVVVGRTQNERPRPGRRRLNGFPRSSATWTHCWIVSLLVLLTLCSQAEASRRRSGRRSSYGRFVEVGEIHIDRSPPPRLDLHRRQDGGDLFQTTTEVPKAAKTAISAQSSDMSRPDFSSPATAIPSTATDMGSIVAPTGDSTSSASPAQTSIISAGGGDTSLPKAFDGGLGSNYTAPSCPLFLNSFLNNDTFTNCMPFSLLLQTSMSFFAASKSPSTIARTLDSACNVVLPTCTALMSTLTTQLRTDSACGADYKLQNPMVRQAYAGLVAYAPLYQASCLKDTSSKSNKKKENSYCFANAITNTTSPADAYVYYLPLGMPLPGGSQLTCSQCLKDTMGYFNGIAGNKSQPISADYTQAAQMINMGCGPGFVNQTVSHLSQEGAAARSSLAGLGTAFFVGTVMLAQLL